VTGRDRAGVRTPLRVGGQAVIEGVMMRAGDHACVAVRRCDGSIEARPMAIPGWARSTDRIPLVRGLAALAESLSVGVAALRWSEERSLPPRADGKQPAPVWLLVAIALVAVVTMIVIIPATVAGLVPHSSPWFAVIETVTRLAVAGAYVAAVGRRPEVRRVFEYHGAEHLVVAAHEAGRPLTPDGVRPGSIHHPRCGTSFLLVIAAVAAAVHPVLPTEPWGDRMLSRIIVVPAVAAIAYEVLTLLGRLAAARPGGPVERLLLWPQRLTTRQPDDAQIEVAVAALEGALADPPLAAPASRRRRNAPFAPALAGANVELQGDGVRRSGSG
jgi:uncharacterized protein YqhQ